MKNFLIMALFLSFLALLNQASAKNTEPNISIADISIDAGDNAVFTVTLSASYNKDITIDYETSDGTATDGYDYTGINNTTLTVEKKTTEATISVPSSPSGSGYFSLKLSNASVGDITDDSATATIIPSIDLSLSELFVNGIVTHKGSSTDSSSVYFDSNTQLIDASDYLLYADLVNNNTYNTDSCVSQGVDCDTDSAHAPKSPLNLTDFSISSENNYAVAYQGTQSLSPGEYGKITTNQSTLTFDSGSEGDDAIYQIATLALSYNDKVTFGPGRYWIENFSMNSGTNISLDLEDDERVILFVKSDVTIQNSLNENGDANQLIIISYGNLKIKSNKTVNGFIYADSSLTFESPSTVNGAVAGHTVTLNNKSIVNFVNTGNANSCSDYIGKATINEVSKANKNKDSDDDFIELKLLSNTISSSIYSNWSIQVCEYGNTNCSIVNLSDGEFDFTTSPWLVAKGSSTIGSYIDINNGTEITLFDGPDASGGKIDYLSIAGYSPNTPSCTFTYDTDAVASSSNASPFRAIRLPDGTGDWNMPSGNSTKATEGASNDGTSYDQPELVAGRITLNNTTSTPSFTHVCFDTPFSAVPVVFSLPTTENNSDRLALRIRNVTKEGFDIAQVESTESANPNSPNGNVSQTVDFLAIVEGDYNLEGGAQMRVSSLNTQRFQSSRISGDSWETISISDLDFSQTPSIIASIQTMNNETNPFPTSDPFLATTIKDVSTSEFKIALERAETNAEKTIDDDETVGYIAITSGFTGKLTDSINYESFLTSKINGINSCNTFDLAEENAETPFVIASQNTREGGNGGWVKRCSISSTNIGFSIVEDMDKDSDTSHVNEQVGGLALHGTFKNFTGNCSTSEVYNFKISHDGSASTCSAEAVTITACSDADCNTTLTSYGGKVNISTSTSHGDWVNNNAQGSFSASSSDSGSATYTFSSDDNGKIVLNLTDTHAETLKITVEEDASTTSSTSGSLSFSDNVFVIESNDGSLFVAGRDEAMNVSLYTNNGNNCAVNTLYTGSKSLNIWKNDDAADPGGAAPTISSTIVPDSASTDFQLSFSSGVASFDFTTTDVGKYTLNIQDDSLTFADKNIDGDISITTRPFGFYVTVSGNPGASSADDNAFTAAGAPFTASATAVLWQSADDKNDDGIPDNHGDNDPSGNATLSDNDAAASFGQEENNEAETITLNGYEYLPTANAGSNILNGTLTISSFTKGKGSSSDLTYNEVGIIEIEAALTDGSYLGAGAVIGDSSYVGRFTPAYFEITGTPEDGSLNAGFDLDYAQRSFAYTGEMESNTSTEGQISYAILPEFTITAKASGGTTTENYSGSFMKLSTDSIVRVEPIADASQDGADEENKVKLAANLKAVTLSENAGVITSQFNTEDNFVYTREANALISPFTADIDLQITSIIDEDNIAATDTDTDSDNGILTLNPTGIEIRFGRQYIENVHGAETSDLRVPMALQYWNGSEFSSNTEDSFTAFDSAECSLDDYQDLTEGSTSLSGSGYFTQGATQALTLSAPSNASRGSVTVTCDVSSWLQYDWNDSNSSYDENPFAQATFGLYRGNDRIIYRGENFE